MSLNKNETRIRMVADQPKNSINNPMVILCS